MKALEIGREVCKCQIERQERKCEKVYIYIYMNVVKDLRRERERGKEGRR